MHLFLIPFSTVRFENSAFSITKRIASSFVSHVLMPLFSPSLPALCFEQNPSDVPWCGVAFLRRMSSFQPVVVAHNAEKVMLRFHVDDGAEWSVDYYLLNFYLLSLLPHCVKKLRGPVIPEHSAYAILGWTCYPSFPPFPTLPSLRIGVQWFPAHMTLASRDTSNR